MEPTFRVGKASSAWGIAGVLELLVQVVSDEVKEGLEIRVTGVLGELLTGIVEAG